MAFFLLLLLPLSSLFHEVAKQRLPYLFNALLGSTMLYNMEHFFHFVYGVFFLFFFDFLIRSSHSFEHWYFFHVFQMQKTLGFHNNFPIDVDIVAICRNVFKKKKKHHKTIIIIFSCWMPLNHIEISKMKLAFCQSENIWLFEIG